MTDDKADLIVFFGDTNNTGTGTERLWSNLSTVRNAFLRKERPRCESEEKRRVLLLEPRHGILQIQQKRVLCDCKENKRDQWPLGQWQKKMGVMNLRS